MSAINAVHWLDITCPFCGKHPFREDRIPDRFGDQKPTFETQHINVACEKCEKVFTILRRLKCEYWTR